MLKYILCLILVPLQLMAVSIDSDEKDPDILIYGDTVQVNAELDNEYSQLVAGAPINGWVMVTHNAKQVVETGSFTLDGKAFKVELVQSTQMSSSSPLTVSIYRFQLQGLNPGIHQLGSIKVKVGGKYYQAPPLTVVISAA